MAGEEAGIRLILWLFRRFLCREAERTPDGAWLVRYSLLTQGFFAAGFLMFAMLALVCILVTRADPNMTPRERLAIGGIFGGFALLFAWLVQVFRLSLLLSETGFLLLRPLRAPLDVHWHEVQGLILKPMELRLVLHGGRTLTLVLIGLNGVSRLREFLDRKLPAPMAVLRASASSILARDLPPLPSPVV